jgi:hypothetical protein
MHVLFKLLIVTGFLLLAGCVIAPVGAPAGVYVGPAAVGAYVAVRPYYYGYGPRLYYGRRS